MVAKLTHLLKDENASELANFTRRIQTNPSSVYEFEIAFDRLFSEDLLPDWDSSTLRLPLVERIECCAEDLVQFLEKSNHDYILKLEMINHGSEVTIEISWYVQQFGTDFLWDRFTAEVDDIVLLFAEVGYMFGGKRYRCAPRDAFTGEAPLFRYHPERYKSYRHHADQIGKLYRQKVEPSAGMLTLEQLQQLGNHIMVDINERSRRYPRKLKTGNPNVSLVMEAENMLAMAYGRFVQAGRQILDFPPSLINMLAKTDIDDIPLNSIKLPYAAQYLHFGPQAGLELEPGWLVDGAYVEQRGRAGDIRFTVTAVPTDHDKAEFWYLFPEAMYTQDFVAEYNSMHMGAAIDTVLTAKLAELRKRMDKAGGDITTALRSQLVAKGAAMPEGLTVLDATARLAIERDELVRRRHPIYKTALQLVVNSLCYISAYPDDIASIWPAGTPKTLREKAEKEKGKESARAKSKLAAMGYVPVHICGQRISDQQTEFGFGAGAFTQVATHWRRGHWRQQAHGTGRTLRKLIWVMPVLVRKDQGDEPAAGHLYLVS